jgi:hypothetical protein
VKVEPRQALPIDPLQYRAIEPRTTHQQLAAFIARLLAIGCMLYTIRPILSAVNAASGQYRNYSYYFQSQYGRPNQTLALFAGLFLPWTAGAAAVLVNVSAAGVVMAKSGFRRFLIVSILILGGTMLATNLLMAWPNILNLSNVLGATGSRPRSASGQSEFRVMLSFASLLTPTIEYLVFPTFVAILLSRRNFVELYRQAEATALPAGVRLSCVVGIVMASLGIVWRPMSLLIDQGSPGGGLNERHPLGLPVPADGMLLLWHVLTRFVLICCSVALLVGAIQILNARPRGRRTIVAQAIIAIIINTVETGLLIILLNMEGTSGLFLSSVLSHLAVILPATALDVALWVYFSSNRVKRALDAPSLVSSISPPPLPHL